MPDLTETELAKKVSKTVSEAESKIIDNTNIYQYGGFRSKEDRAKLKDSLNRSPKNTQADTSKNEDVSENLEAGSALVPTKQPKMSKFWSSLTENNIIISSKHLSSDDSLHIYRVEYLPSGVR